MFLSVSYTCICMCICTLIIIKSVCFCGLYADVIFNMKLIIGLLNLSEIFQSIWRIARSVATLILGSRNTTTMRHASYAPYSWSGPQLSKAHGYLVFLSQ